MRTIATVVASGRDRSGPALDAPGRGSPYDYSQFCTNVWKAGNLLRQYGVRPGARMSVVVGPKNPADAAPGQLGQAGDPLLAILGGATLGATVDIAPDESIGGRAAVLPTAWLDRYEAQAGCSRLAYGASPAVADVTHYETALWSENPIEPPASVAPNDPVLRDDDGTYTHEALLRAADTLASDRALGPGDTVAMDTPLTSAGAFVAGILTPLTAGATILPTDGAEARADAAIAYRVSVDETAGHAETLVRPSALL